MNILDIAIAKELAGGGGGSGTDNYNDLSNLPKINDTTLSGNKSSSALGLQSEINSDSKLASDLVDDTNQDNKFVTSTEKNTWNAKQNAIDADHKINADYVDDSTSTNKFVTASDKETWNAKQNAIDNSHKLSSDLVDDANHTNKFVTSTEKQTWNAKQNAIDSDHKLSSSLVSFTTAEAVALASGIDSSKVGQISTNQTNILSVKEYTRRNVLSITDRAFTAGTNNRSAVCEIPPLSGKVVVYFGSLTSTDTDSSYCAVGFSDTNGTTITTSSINRGNDVSVTLDLGDSVATSMFIYPGNSWTASAGDSLEYKNGMVIEKELYDHDPSYTGYSAPNYDLTYLESQDRAALAEEIDAGAKNAFDWSKVDLVDRLSVSNGVFTTTCTDTQTNLRFSLNGLNSSKEIVEYFVGNASRSYQVITTNGIYAFPFTMKSDIVYLRFGHNGAQQNGRGDINVQHLTVGKTYIFVLNITQCSSSTSTFKWQDVMICTKAAFGVSSKFVPFGNDPFYQIPINHNMIYRGRNLGASLTDAQHTALSSGNFTDLYLGDYWTKTVTIPAGTYTGGDGEEVTVPAQTNITLKAVIADFDTFYAGYASTYAGINTHHAAVIVTGFSNVVWNKTNSTAGGYVASLIHKWLVGSALPQIETWFGSAKVLSHQKLLTNAITGDAASGWAWSSQKISLLSENQMYGSKVWGGSKATNGGYEPGEAFKHLNVFNHIDANLLFGNKYIWLRDIASAVWVAYLGSGGLASRGDASDAWVAPAALILLS